MSATRKAKWLIDATREGACLVGLDEMDDVMLAGIEPGAIELEGRPRPVPQTQHLGVEAATLIEPGGLDGRVVDPEDEHLKRCPRRR